MGRGSDKNGPQLDDELKDEVQGLDHMHNAESRSDNARAKEDVAPEATQEFKVEDVNEPS